MTDTTTTRLGGRRTNVGTADRWISGIVGGLLLSGVARRRSLPGKAMSLVGGWMMVRRASSGHSALYERFGVSTVELEQGGGLSLEAATTIRRPRMELYRFWSDQTNFPLFMTHVIDVSKNPDGSTHWSARVAGNREVEWDARVTNQSEGEFIAWHSVPGSRIEHAGSVHFTDAGEKGTEVHVKLRYVPPGGAIGMAWAKAMNPVTEVQVTEDLRTLKHMLETGTDISTEGQPTGEAQVQPAPQPALAGTGAQR